MVIIANQNGQLCNRLFFFSYFIANAIEHEYKVVNLCFGKYLPFFQTTTDNSFFGLPVSVRITESRFLDRLILKGLNHTVTARWFPGIDVLRNAQSEYYDLETPAYLQLTRRPLLLIKGWLFRDEKNLKKYRSELRKIFEPVASYSAEIQKIFSRLRADFDVIIGIHIRRGDYDEWEGGKYYYDWQVYYGKMREMAEVIQRGGQTCGFFIASNEMVDELLFSGLNAHIAQRHMIVDLYGLAECDYIIGPPSTFSYWAAFYGQKPILELKDPQTTVTKEAFVYF